MTIGQSESDVCGAPLVEELAPAPDPGEALAAFADLPGVALFESRLMREGLGRYSFLTADPVEVVQIDRVACGDDPFARLRELAGSFRAETVSDLPPFQGGVAGVLSYELGHAFEEFPFARHDEFCFPALAAGVYDWVLAWDHRQQRAWVIVQPVAGRRPEERLAWVHAMLGDGAEGNGDQGSGMKGMTSEIGNRSERVPIQSPFHQIAPGMFSDFSRDDYLRAVERAIEFIHAGDVFQVNLSQRLLFPQLDSPLELYRRLRDVNRATFAGYFAFDDWAVVSASPERFLRVAGDEVETRPIKGTRKRHRGPEADLFTRDELRQSDKDQAENVMIVDLLRNDLSRVCAPGSIRVPHLCSVETYETVQHLVSEVRGRLESPHDAWDLLAAAFPGGSITGAPKVRAMEIISELEPTARGPYCGSLFYAGFDGTVDGSILIRTFLCRGGWIQCSAGGGVVAQSDPAAEYEETLHKAEGMLRALR